MPPQPSIAASAHELNGWVRHWQDQWEAQTHSPDATSRARENPLRSGPRRLLDYLRFQWKTKFQSYEKLHSSPHTFETWLHSWLINFDQSDEDRYYAFLMASRIYFLSSSETKYLLHIAYQHIQRATSNFDPRKLLFVDLSAGISFNDFYNVNKIAGYRDMDPLTRWRLDISPEELLSPIKDLNRIARFKTLLERLPTLSNFRPLLSDAQLSPEHFSSISADLTSTRSQALQTSLNTLDEKLSTRHLVLLADFTGSGQTVANDLRRIAKHYSLDHILLVPLVATSDALDKFRHAASEKPTPRILIAPALTITPAYKALSPSTTLFSREERHRVRNLCDTYFCRFTDHPDVKKHGEAIKYGYGRCELLFVRQGNTPNNSLPLIWARGENWTPLFERTSSYVSHSTGG